MGSTMRQKAEGQQGTEVEDETVVDGLSIETGEDETGTASGNVEGQGTGSESEDDGVVVTIGEEAPPPEEDESKAPEWVRDLRKQHRDLVKRNRELEEKVKTQEAPEQKPVTLGAKPTLEGCDYDAEKYEADLAAWYERKRQADEEARKAEAEQQAANEAWQAKLNAYGKAKAEIKVKDFDDAEAAVQTVFSKTQQGILMQGADNPALLVYALGKNPQKAKELAAITDPVKYAFAVAKLETQLKVTQRKAPPPEKTVTGSGGVSGGAVDSTLERLRAEAEKTGDYTKVMAYKRSKRQG